MSESHDPQTPSTKPVGEALRLARKANNWSQQDISSRLNLNPSIIELMEKDDYPNAQLDVYHRGYLRLYSQLLGLNADSMLEQLSQSGFCCEDACISMHSTDTTSTERWSIHLSPPLKIALATLTGVIILALIWFRPAHQPPAPTLKTLQFETHHKESATDEQKH